MDGGMGSFRHITTVGAAKAADRGSEPNIRWASSIEHHGGEVPIHDWKTVKLEYKLSKR